LCRPTAPPRPDRFFAGAKEVDRLINMPSRGIPHFDLAIDFGWFYFLTKPIFLVLQYFYRLLGNFGLAILLLTTDQSSLLFFPLRQQIYAAMSKMKLLQPEMQKIRERFSRRQGTPAARNHGECTRRLAPTRWPAACRS